MEITYECTCDNWYECGGTYEVKLSEEIEPPNLCGWCDDVLEVRVAPKEEESNNE